MSYSNMTLREIRANVDDIADEDVRKIEEFIDEATDNGTHYFGQTYEDGLRAALEFLAGDVEDVDEIL